MSAPRREPLKRRGRASARVGLLTLTALLAACAVGPRYHAPSPESAGMHVGVSGLPDSTRAFFDSLASARASDSIADAQVPAARQLIVQDSMAGVAWLDIVRDTVLVRLVNTALQQNGDVKTALARIREYQADAGVAKSSIFPDASINASVSSAQVALGFLPPAAYHATRVTGDVSWELDFWGRIRQGMTAARADVAAQVAEERGTVLSLVSDVATSYLQLLELDQEHEIAQQTLASRKVTLDLARQRYAQGLVSELDVKQFEAQVSAPAVTLASTERARSETSHALNVLLGEGPTDIPRGGTLADAVQALAVPDSVPASLLNRRPDVQAAERRYAAATARLGMADAARLPPIMLTGSYGSQSPTPSQLFNDNTRVYALQLGVSIPIFDGNRLASEAAAARARVEQARAQYQQTVMSALRDAGDALVAVRTTRDQAVAQATQVSALQEAFNLAELRYQAGLASYLELLDAQRSLFSAQLAASQAQFQQLTAAVQLYKALGGGWPGQR